MTGSTRELPGGSRAYRDPRLSQAHSPAAGQGTDRGVEDLLEGGVQLPRRGDGRSASARRAANRIDRGRTGGIVARFEGFKLQADGHDGLQIQRLQAAAREGPHGRPSSIME